MHACTQAYARMSNSAEAVRNCTPVIRWTGKATAHKSNCACKRVHAQAQAIRAAITAAEHDAALTAEGHTRVVPHKDVRPAEAQAADEDIVQQVLIWSACIPGSAC